MEGKVNHKATRGGCKLVSAPQIPHKYVSDRFIAENKERGREGGKEGGKRKRRVKDKKKWLIPSIALSFFFFHLPSPRSSAFIFVHRETERGRERERERETERQRETEREREREGEKERGRVWERGRKRERERERERDRERETERILNQCRDNPCWNIWSYGQRNVTMRVWCCCVVH